MKPLLFLARFISLIATSSCLAATLILTENTLIEVNDLSYDGSDLVVSNCTVTINGPHSFNSLLVHGTMSHSPATNGEPSHLLDLAITHDLVLRNGTIDVSGRGYGPGKGPGAGWSSNTNLNFKVFAEIPPRLQTIRTTYSTRFEWSSTSGFTYQPEISTNLISWKTYGQPQPGTGGPLSINLPEPSNPANQFYRVKVPLP
jgi:hypothetical protein